MKTWKNDKDHQCYLKNKDKRILQEKERYYLKHGCRKCVTCGKMRQIEDGWDICNGCISLEAQMTLKKKPKKEYCSKCHSPFENDYYIRTKIPTEIGNICSKCYFRYQTQGYYSDKKTID